MKTPNSISLRTAAGFLAALFVVATPVSGNAVEDNPFAQALSSATPASTPATEGTQPAAGTPAAKMLEQLDKLAKDRSQKKTTGLKSVTTMVEQAGANQQAAIQAYTDAYRDVELAGKVTQAQDLQAWKDKNSELFIGKEFRGAVQLHLQYLALTLKRSASKQPADFVAPSIAYLKELAAWEAESTKAAELAQQMQAVQQPGAKKQGGQKSGGKPTNQASQILKDSVANSLFAKAWKLAPFLSGLQGWELSPGNAEGIFEQNIRAVYREKKDPKILETWDWQIQMEEAKLANTKKAHALETFRTRKLPELYMRKAADQAKIGQPVAAAAEAMKILNANIEHPSFEKWVKIARQWLMGNTATEEITDSGSGKDAPAYSGGQETGN